MGRGSKTKKGSSKKGRTGSSSSSRSVIDGSQGSSSSYSSSSGTSENDAQPKLDVKSFRWDYGMKGSSSSSSSSSSDIWHGFPGGNPYEPGTMNFEIMRKRRQSLAFLRKVCKPYNYDDSPIIPPDDPYAPDDPRCREYFATQINYVEHIKDDPEGIALLTSGLNRLKLERECKPTESKDDGSVYESGKNVLA